MICHDLCYPIQPLFRENAQGSEPSRVWVNGMYVAVADLWEEWSGFGNGLEDMVEGAIGRNDLYGFCEGMDEEVV